MRKISPDTVMEDIEIIRLVKTGDTNSFALLVERYHRAVLSFIYNTVHRADIVEDIGQEVFLNAYLHIGNFDENRGVPFSAWLFAIARNRCISEIRKIKKPPEMPLDENSVSAEKDWHPEDQLERKERREMLEAALSILDEPFRSTMVNSMEGLSIIEIASKSSLSLNTVKTRLFRAREKLRKILKVHNRGESL
jgi:RNA polymerase sigma-70 factor, ECF subfamily